ncbi:MAG TPA: hypothetical protein VNO82_09235 [Solirubrobacteraceae bacterium]|nr:hypothetical protein [Solirubrobacteraceae bacterium]
MFERFKRDGSGTTGTTAVADRPVSTANGTTAHSAVPADREQMHAVRARQREEYGGINWGAAFFGWLVAVGLGALLVGILAAAGAAVGLTELSDETAGNATEIGLGGAIALLAALAIAYFAGGYVAGRMSRFDGARQGMGMWLLGLVLTAALAVAGAILGSEYNVLERLELPAVPVGDSELATGGALALAIVVVGTLIAAVAGGKSGERYHHKVDRAGFAD